ncbi:ABC transporter transmembrane domain-containing protein [Streptomyces sp. KR80]|uniref:ABC transporter transmembrane domain-containing protein n=1 Tax=Streptomyces sp. KR80 TaxID=3457426 RepID=UPI003FCFD28A
MQIRDLPYPEPGVPDVRSGPRFLMWLGCRQLGGQVKALLWGSLHMSAVALLPAAIGLAVDAVVDPAGPGGPGGSGVRLALAGGLIAVLGGLIALSDTMLHRAAVTNWISAVTRVQQLLARKAAEMGAVLTRRVAAGEITAVSTGDVEKIGWFVEALSRFTAAALTTVAVCGALLVYRPELGVVVAVGVPVLALAVMPLLPNATRRADEQREKAGRATELASDTVAGLRVLRGIGGEELFLGRYRRASQEVRRAAVRSARMWALISAVQVLLPGLLLIVVVLYGARLALDSRISVGELVTVYGAVTFLLFPLQLFEEIAMAYSFSRPSAKRAARVLGLRRTAQVAGRPTTAQLTGDLYDPVSGLLAPEGRLTVVVCGDPDAAGRLADRLGGHAVHQADDQPSPAIAGKCPLPSALLGEVALDELPLAVARSAVLVQDKDPVLLSGTLAELLDVPSSGAVSAADALAAAQCGDVLDALALAAPDTATHRTERGDPMRTRITERGRSLSGGQRQRLALARSLVADPEVLVLDEPTSAVDSHTEARIAEGLRRIRAGRTTVVFASSPLLLDRAERVVFVPEGEVAAVGLHRELLRDHTGYREVVTRETEEERRKRIAGQAEPSTRDSLEAMDDGLDEMEESA